jgi:quinol monooxygenase YgiN
MNIYLTAIVNGKPEKVEELKAQLQQLVIESRKEAACIQYDLHQSIEESNLFTFHEIWESYEGLMLHDQQPHIKAFGLVADELLDGPVKIIRASKVA